MGEAVSCYIRVVTPRGINSSVVVPGSLVSSTDRAQTGQCTLFAHAHTNSHTSCYITTGSCEVHTSAACVCLCACVQLKK